MYFKELFELGIDVKNRGGEQKTTCPKCSADRKKKNDRCLAVDVDGGKWYCHHCGWHGAIRERSWVVPEVKHNPPSTIEKYFNDRCISVSTLKRWEVGEGMEFMPQVGKEVNCIFFNYFENGDIVNIKYRDGAKHFKLFKGAKLILYGIDFIKDADEIVITEGEIDALSCYEAGIFNVCSVPAGAGKNTDYIENSWKYLKDKKFVICADNDSKGYVLQNELPRRLGINNCRIATYPQDCKDINDVLCKHGKGKVKEVIDNAQLPKVEGLITVDDISDKLDDIWKYGYPEKKKCGYDPIDNLVSFMPMQWSLFTGGAKSGKSEVLDAIIVGLAYEEGDKTAIYSFENRPYEYHAEKLVGKVLGKRPRKENTTYMELQRAKDFVSDHFFWLDVGTISIQNILAQAEIYVKEKGVNNIVIDPYNKLESSIPKGQTETQHINEILKEIGDFCILYQVHIFLVAHPTKPRRTESGFSKFSLYDVSGSSNFYNQLYNGIVIQKPDEDEGGKYDREFDCQAVRFYWCGQRGNTMLTWKPEKGGRYWDYNETKTQQTYAPF